MNAFGYNSARSALQISNDHAVVHKEHARESGLEHQLEVCHLVPHRSVKCQQPGFGASTIDE
jgi:hypothetical protein